jgi:hypothetical protein
MTDHVDHVDHVVLGDLRPRGHELHKKVFTLGDPPSVALQNHLPDPS